LPVNCLGSSIASFPSFSDIGFHKNSPPLASELLGELLLLVVFLGADFLVFLGAAFEAEDEPEEVLVVGALLSLCLVLEVATEAELGVLA
jgi:uncharacterized membrane protein